VVIPDPALVVLVGPSGSGKSHWAATRYRAVEIVASDALRAVLGSGTADLDASIEAFALLETIVAARLRRGLTTVIDTLGLDAARRRGWLAAARAAGLPTVAVVFDTPAATCRTRNAARERPVPAPVLAAQLRQMLDIGAELGADGWSLIAAPEASVEAAHSSGARQAERVQREDPKQLEFVLQVSRFPWGDDPAGWLRTVAEAAEDAGFGGLTLMDHLIQIPQVGRDFEPIPDPLVTLGMLGALPTRLRLGTLVSPLSVRAAGPLAKAVATLDVLTGGRAFCGVGAGWWEREHRAFGLPFQPLAARAAALEAGIETIRALWAPGTRPFQGSQASLPETTCYPRPVSAIPIVVGGASRRLLSIAGRLGDACNVPAALDRLDDRLAILRRESDRAGRAVAVTVLDVPVVGRDRDDAATRVERLRGRSSAVAYARTHHAGQAEDHIGRYRLLADRGVSTVFLALPDLATAEDVTALKAIVTAFG
jgi:alkanesulfonate monooxygenase SsuD/methylene tetrahydromethanopterin reductase-like flavin-dependent oxidoreductase (luciferase family)/predicted kinase